MRQLWVKSSTIIRKLCVIGIGTLCFLQSTNASELPDLGNSSSAILNPTQEYELGRTALKEIQSQLSFSQDEIVNEYLQGLGYRLVAIQGQSQMPYQFFTLKDSSLNAFALPGGFICVNSGLILASESESELAGVLAHEVAHVQQRHIARMYEHMGKVQLSTIAGMIASLILATQSGQAAQGAMMATLAGSSQAMINYTREHEKEADAVGIRTMVKAGFDPMGMPSFFHRMYQHTRYYGINVPEYLLTHPLTESRLVLAQARAKEYPYRQIPDSLQYHLVQARVQIESFATPNDATNYFAKKLQRGNYRSREGTQYGYALALITEGKPMQAKPYLDELEKVSANPLIQLAYAQMELGLGQTQSGLARLQNTMKNHPNNYALTLSFSDSLIKAGYPDQAIGILKKQLLVKPVKSKLYAMLSRAYSAAKQPAMAHLSQAQYLRLQGDFTGAMAQLRIAKKSAPTAQESTQIDSQLKEVEKKLPT